MIFQFYRKVKLNTFIDINAYYSICANISYAEFFYAKMKKMNLIPPDLDLDRFIINNYNLTDSNIKNLKYLLKYYNANDKITTIGALRQISPKWKAEAPVQKIKKSTSPFTDLFIIDEQPLYVRQPGRNRFPI